MIAKLIKGIFKLLLFLIVILGAVLIATNPNQTEVEQHVKAHAGSISVVRVAERRNYLLFSAYRVEVSGLKHGILSERYFLGILGQVVEIEQ